MSRFKFNTDPSRGDATVTITSLQAPDTATYLCKVKKTPGIDSRKVTIVVLGETLSLSLLTTADYFIRPLGFCRTGSLHPNMPFSSALSQWPEWNGRWGERSLSTPVWCLSPVTSAQPYHLICQQILTSHLEKLRPSVVYPFRTCLYYFEQEFFALNIVIGCLWG